MLGSPASVATDVGRLRRPTLVAIGTPIIIWTPKVSNNYCFAHATFHTQILSMYRKGPERYIDYDILLRGRTNK